MYMKQFANHTDHLEANILIRKYSKSVLRTKTDLQLRGVWRDWEKQSGKKKQETEVSVKRRVRIRIWGKMGWGSWVKTPHTEKTVMWLTWGEEVCSWLIKATFQDSVREDFLCVLEILFQNVVSLKSVHRLLACGTESILSKTCLIHLTLEAKSTTSEIITHQYAWQVSLLQV